MMMMTPDCRSDNKCQLALVSVGGRRDGTGTELFFEVASTRTATPSVGKRQ
jgi:hypothetical protein